jgi:hypothetical protein
MNRDLFLAILSMDSYNRGYGQSIKAQFLPAGSIGHATILAQSGITPQSAGFQAGFYAIAYQIKDDFWGRIR